ncbi:MAG: Sua5/YciO/YrdC/YwlC family protein [Gammaproteobacteria bacterium]|nr:Sua5/YciO/YrdC/YwlC family protein [Gammaproteobacteria bacterium]
MISRHNLRLATGVLAAGGVIAYPTEGVFGLGCLPENATAIQRILDMKNRNPDLGFVLVASSICQLLPYLGRLGDKTMARLLAQEKSPVTWVVAANTETPRWITGDRDTIAVRISQHPIVRALCDAADSALVSTSANISGRPPASSRLAVQRMFGDLVDMITPGETGGLGGPTELRDADTGKVLRAGPG